MFVGFTRKFNGDTWKPNSLGELVSLACQSLPSAILSTELNNGKRKLGLSLNGFGVLDQSRNGFCSVSWTLVLESF